MYFIGAAICSFFVLVATLPIYAQTPKMENMSILTGEPKGTYIQFGKDIANIAKENCEINLKVKQSTGSLENLKRLNKEPFTQLAIVQEDVLDFIKNYSNNTELNQYSKDLRYIYSLYPEEVHIVARRDSGITKLSDLAGKKVAIGQINSGTYLTATVILLRAGVKLREVVEIGGREALNSLFDVHLKNRIDAMFYVAGKPVQLFTDLPITSNLTIVAIDDPKVLSRYRYESTITSDDYSWVQQPVKTIGVMSALISYNFQAENCMNVGTVANLIRKNIDKLRSTGHPKWKAVDLNRRIEGWERYGCAARYESLPIGAKDGHRCVFLYDDAAASKNVTSRSGQPESCESENRTAISKFACEGLQEIMQ